MLLVISPVLPSYGLPNKIAKIIPISSANQEVSQCKKYNKLDSEINIIIP